MCCCLWGLLEACFRAPAHRANVQKRMREEMARAETKEDELEKGRQQDSQGGREHGGLGLPGDGVEEVPAASGEGRGHANGARKMSLSELVALRKKERESRGAQDGKGGGGGGGEGFGGGGGRGDCADDAAKGSLSDGKMSSSFGAKHAGQESPDIELARCGARRGTSRRSSSGVADSPMEVSSSLLTAASRQSRDSPEGDRGEDAAETGGASERRSQRTDGAVGAGNQQAQQGAAQQGAASAGLGNARETLRRLKEARARAHLMRASLGGSKASPQVAQAASAPAGSDDLDLC